MPKAALHNLGCKVNAYETEPCSNSWKPAVMRSSLLIQKADVIYYQHRLRDQYRGPQVPPDAAPGQENETRIPLWWQRAAMCRWPLTR